MSRHKGFKHSDETKQKIRLSNILRMKNKTPLEINKWKETISKSCKGKKRSPETRERMRKAQTGKKMSPESRIKMALAKKGFKHTEEVKQRMSINRRGSKGSNWKGGYTKIQILIRGNAKYIYWRKKVFRRDSRTCQHCNISGVPINAHHLKPFSTIVRENDIRTIEQAIDCTELWDINNGITLCEPCHIKTDTYCRRFKVAA